MAWALRERAILLDEGRVVANDLACRVLSDPLARLTWPRPALPHFPNKRRAPGETSRVLRKGERLVICHTASR